MAETACCLQHWVYIYIYTQSLILNLYIYIYLNRDVGEQNLYTHNNKVVSFITLKAFHPFSSVDTWE